MTAKKTKCSRCQRHTALTKGFGGHALCKHCFERQFERRVWRANKELGLLRVGDKVALKRSRDCKAVALAFVLEKMSKKIQGMKLVPASTQASKADKIALPDCADDAALDFLEKAFSKGFEDANKKKRKEKPRIIRPLVYCLESEAREYCKLQGLGFKEAKSKKEKGFRKALRIFLERLEEKHPGTAFNLARASLEMEKAVA